MVGVLVTVMASVLHRPLNPDLTDAQTGRWGLLAPAPHVSDPVLEPEHAGRGDLAALDDLLPRHEDEHGLQPGHHSRRHGALQGGQSDRALQATLHEPAFQEPALQGQSERLQYVRRGGGGRLVAAVAKHELLVRVLHPCNNTLRCALEPGQESNGTPLHQVDTAINC